jgi:hypothetical protein
VAIGLDLARMRLELAERSAAKARLAAEAAFGKLAADDNRQSLWSLEDTVWRRLAEAQRLAGEPRDACASLDAAIRLRAANALPTDPRLVEAREQRARCAS